MLWDIFWYQRALDWFCDEYEYWFWLKTSAFNSVTLVFIGKQFPISFKILMLHAILESILLISSLKFNFLSNIIPRYLTDDDSPLFTPLTLRYDGICAFLMEQTRYILSSYFSSLIDVIGSNNIIFQYFFQITSGYIFISMRRTEESVIGVLDYLTIVIINSSMKIININVEQYWPNTVPCGTPLLSKIQSDSFPEKFTFWVLSFKYDLINCVDVPSNPKHFNFSISISCEIESNAFERSRIAPQTVFFLSISVPTYSAHYSMASVVDTFFLYPKCLGDSKLFEIK